MPVDNNELIVLGEDGETLEAPTAIAAEEASTNIGGSQVGVLIMPESAAPKSYAWVWWTLGVVALAVVLYLVVGSAGKKAKAGADEEKTAEDEE